MSRGCCFKCLWNIFCCGCCRKTSLQIIDESTRLLPKNDLTKNLIEKTQINCFGAVPFNSRQINGKVKKIVCGLSHCLLLIKENNVKHLYGFGLNDEGQLGLEIKNASQDNQDTYFRINIPQNIIHIQNYEIIDIAAGDNFSIILIRDNQGNNNNINENNMIMNENNINNSNYHLIKFGIDENEKYRFGILPKKTYIKEINLPENNMQIKHIYAFGKRIIIQKSSNDNKEILYLGGMDFSGFELDGFELLDFNEQKFLNTKIKNLCLGTNHCIILDEENNLYGIGDNTYGELGGSKVNVNSFSLLDKELLSKIWFQNADKKKFSNKNEFQIKKIVCGSRHTLILSSDGKIFV